MEKRSKRLELAVTILLSAIPSLYLLLRYPPFFNGTDSICYLDFPNGAVPHYPLFYPMYCTAFLKLFGDGMGFVYGIIIVQHIFYTLSVVYIALYFTDFRRRFLFLLSMFFAFRASIYIQGVYTEAWAVIAIGFIVGALLRICLRPADGNNKTHYRIYAGAILLLVLTRFAGLFLIFVLPLFTLIKGLRSKNLWTPQVLKAIARQSLLSVALVFASQLITKPVIMYSRAPESSVYGQPGTYRIWDALNPSYARMQPQEVLARYKNATKDTVLKCTFDIIKRSEREELWWGAYKQLDSLKTSFSSRGIITKPGTTDSYLNAAYRIYIFTPSCYPFKRILPDIGDYFFTANYYENIVGDCEFLLHKNCDSMPQNAPRMKRYMDSHFKVADYHKMLDDSLIYKSGYLITPFILLLVFLLKRRATMAPDLWILFISVVVTGCLCHIITAVITDKIFRYTQPAEFMIYIMWSALLALSSQFKESNSEINSIR